MKHILPAILIVMFLCSAAGATIIRYEFAGTITQYRTHAAWIGLDIGDRITGYFEYDDQQVPDPHFPNMFYSRGEFHPIGFDWLTDTQFYYAYSRPEPYASLSAVFNSTEDGGLIVNQDRFFLGEDHHGTKISGVTDAFTPVPEPATLLLFGAGLIGLSRKFLKSKKA